MKHLRTFFIGLCSFLLLLPVSSVSAFTVGGGEEYILPEGEDVNDDLYVGAANAVINGMVNGDLMIAGGNVTVSNRVEGDLFAAGGNITINAEVGDDLRVAGGSVTILKNVGDDLVAAGGTVHVLKDVEVGGDLIVAGGLVIIDGTVRGNVRIAGGQVSINGTVNGAVMVQADERFSIGPGAVISERVMYTGSKEAEIAEGASVSAGVEFTQREGLRKFDDERRSRVKGMLAAFAGIAFLVQVLMFMVTALLAVHFLKKFSTKLMDTSMKNVGGNMLRGFGFVVLMPIVIVILSLTVLGIPIASIAAITYILMIAIAKIYAGVLLGMWIFKFGSKERVKLDWKVAVIGVLAIEILVLIPFIGWFAVFLIFCTVLGGVYTGAVQRLKDAR